MRILIWAPGFWPLASPSLWPQSWKKWFLSKIMLFSNVKYSHFFLPWWHWHIGLSCLFTRLVSGVTSILLNKRHQMKRYPYCMIHVRNIQKMGKTDSRVSAFRIVTSLGKKQSRSEWGGRWHTSGLLAMFCFLMVVTWIYLLWDKIMILLLHWWFFAIYCMSSTSLKKTLRGGKKQWTYYMLDWQKDLTVSTIWDYVKQPKRFTFLLTV